jgi:predicted transposase YbfD/YdcC
MHNIQEFLKGFEENFSEIKELRQENKIQHPLIEILFLTMVAIAGGALSWMMIEKFGKIHLSVLRKYYPFKLGIPSDDTIRRVFAILDPKHLNASLHNYFAKDLSTEHLAIDGKSIKGSSHNGSKALHILNVYACHSGITLFSKNIDDKKNEISAIPETIDLLDIKGAIVTIDAMGCQKAIAKCIIKKGANYIFGLKNNHPTFYKEVATAFEGYKYIAYFTIDTHTTIENGHGRTEERECRVINDLCRLKGASLWAGLSSIIEIKRKVTIKNKVTQSTHYYISSLNSDSKTLMEKIRSHWKIESMHWVLDVVFKEDACSMYKGNTPANLAIIRRFVLNVLSGMKEKRETKPMLIKMIGWSQEYLNRFIKKLIICS